jgi:hypothetical protein
LFFFQMVVVMVMVVGAGANENQALLPQYRADPCPFASPEALCRRMKPWWMGVINQWMGMHACAPQSPNPAMAILPSPKNSTNQKQAESGTSHNFINPPEGGTVKLFLDFHLSQHSSTVFPSIHNLPALDPHQQPNGEYSLW